MVDKKDDKKKGGKKDEKKAPAGNTVEEMFATGVIILLVIAFVYRAIDFFKPGSTGDGVSNSYFEAITGGPNGWFANTLHFIGVAISVYVTAATIFSMVTFLAILYVAWLTYKLSVEDKKKNSASPKVEELPSLQSQKWQQVMNHVNSQNPAEWRLSILEADVMLDDMMQHLGFHGDTLGERLKNTSKADFKNIDSAWEAHKIRNAIAHEGSGFLLSQRESKRVIELYQVVFNEFKYV